MNYSPSSPPSHGPAFSEGPVAPRINIHHVHAIFVKHHQLTESSWTPRCSHGSAPSRAAELGAGAILDGDLVDSRPVEQKELCA
eukprot:CAMPEP_0168361176 /NCGR_PEP_ID=MMETSP0228-20121227/2535_1 /TAXON_ID=133427 /ORGANISM="Protoceratium reticulatum, Strain CCCM 535 (=CCMP 1889)" /LENGTH=83 /DNA_ID=CAMNT_0008373853 /DNA_START=430 /DNA_END=681 /DNA_ORIENTATION=-